MRRTIRAIATTTLVALVLAVSGVSWYAFSSPPEQHLTLAANLIDSHSAEGVRLFADSSASVDYGQLLPYFVSQSRRGFCGVATASMTLLSDGTRGGRLHKMSLDSRPMPTDDEAAIRDRLAKLAAEGRNA